jgi:hypothetical protein
MQTLGLQERGAFLAMAGLLSACAHAPATPDFDRSSDLNLAPIAARFQGPRCQVSVPMSQEEALRYVEQWNVPHPESRPDWIAMTKATQPGDQLREVTCVKKGRSGGNVFLGLFREGTMVAEMHFVILD